MEMGKKKHFVLVHGVCFGSWCWYKVVAQLRSQGYKVTAIDLAASGINPKTVEEVNSLYDFSEPLIDFMESLPPEERVILVGHSMGGVCISIAMEKFPQRIAVAVFMASSMPSPEINTQEIVDHMKPKDENEEEFNLDCTRIYGNGDDQPPTAFIFGHRFLSTKLCQLSPLEDITLASLLARPAATSVRGGFQEATKLSKENYGSVRRAYFITEKDKLRNSKLQRWMIEKNPPDEVKVIHDSDHMPMFSRPKELCSYLLDIYEKYN